MTDVETFIDVIMQDNQVAEMRIPKAKYNQTHSGVFDDKAKLAAAAHHYDNRVKAIYMTLNKINPALLARSKNHITENAELTTSDKDVVSRTWLPLDIDPIRPAGISSTDEEHALAIEKALKISEYMSGLGWPEPVICDSGNGSTLLYRIDIPNTEENAKENTEIIKKCLSAFDFLFTDKKIEIDLTVFNAARVIKLTGTVAKKGDDVEERPHRRSALIRVPDKIEKLSIEKMLELIEMLPKEPVLTPESKSVGGFNVEAWMQKYGINVHSTKLWNGGMLYSLEECPFDSNHKAPDSSIIQMKSGAIAFNCFHNSCGDKTWQDLRKKNEPDYEEKKGKKPKAGRENGNDGENTSYLVELVNDEAVELFHDENQNPYARILIDGRKKIMAIDSKEFKRWISHKAYTLTDRVPGSTTINSLIGVIEGKACYEGKEYTLSNRVCWHEGAIWYDMGDWSACRITADGWEIIKDSPILFRRYNHQKPHEVGKIALPGKGDFRKIRKFINIQEEGKYNLFSSSVVSYYIPGIPHPVIIPHGEQGSTKSTLFSIIKNLVDPSVIALSTFSKDDTELVQQLSHHYFTGYDNVTYLSNWQSDALCRATTGTAGAKRSLFTNDDDFIFHFRRCIGLNGINVVATKPDLLDRSVLIELQRIPEENRKTEEVFWREFEEAKGDILGGIFDIISDAMKIKDAITLKRSPRMADFALWGSAISLAMGYKLGEFLGEYNNNIQLQNTEAISNAVVGELILLFMETRQVWTGTASDLFLELKFIADNANIDIRAGGFPKAAHALSRKLTELKTNLQKEGIIFVHDRNEKKRFLSLTKSEPKKENSVVTENDAIFLNSVMVSPKYRHFLNRMGRNGKNGNDGNDANDAINGNSTFFHSLHFHENEEKKENALRNCKDEEKEEEEKREEDRVPENSVISVHTVMPATGDTVKHDDILQIPAIPQLELLKRVKNYLQIVYGSDRPSKEGISMVVDQLASDLNESKDRVTAAVHEVLA